MVVNSAADRLAAPADDAVRAYVDRAIQGDAAAFGQIYDIYVETVYRYLFYRLGRPTEAEDLTEQVFLRAWEGIHRFRWQGKPFVAWLYRVAHNVLVDHFRAHRVIDRLEPHHERPHPADDIELQIEAEDLAAAIRQLTDDQQEVIILRFMEELGHAEIAARTGRREGAVRALQLRALRSLRKIVERRER